MKKGFKQRAGLALFLATSVALTACNSGAPGDSGAAPSGSTEPGGASGGSNEPVTLQMFALTSDRSGVQEGWWPDILEKEIGVKLDIIPTGDQGLQKLQALMAGGELPDIVIFNQQKQVEDAVKADMLINLDEHLDKLPNVVKHAEQALQFYRDTASNGTGKAYAIPTEVGPIPQAKDMNYGPYSRWDLYKQLGMPQVNTLEDYLPLLKQMQELEPTNKDGQKTYGFTLWKEWDGSTMYLASGMSNLIGYDSGDKVGETLPFMELNFMTGETKSILAPDSQYIRALKFFYEANKMGLVDPDSLTQRFDNAREKFAQGRILFAPQSWLGFDYNTADRTEADPPSGFRPILAKESKVTADADSKIGTTWAFAIGKNTRNLDAALRYIDFMYSVEGSSLRGNGPKGILWDVNEKGEPYITDSGWDIINNNKDMPGGGKLGDSNGMISAVPISGATINPEFNLPLQMNFWPSTLAYKPSKLDQDWIDTTGFTTATEMITKGNYYVTIPEAVKTIPTLPDDMTTIKQRVGDVVKTQSWLAVFAKDEAEFQKHVDEMIRKAEGLGVQQLLDWDQEAWKQAQELVKKYQ